MSQQEKYYAFATIPVKPEYMQQAEQAILDITPETLAEPGCEVFTLHKRFESDMATLYLYEIFTDEEAFNFHHAQSYTKAVFKKYETWLAGPVDINRLTCLS